MATQQASKQRVALVTGANKGIGFSVADQLAKSDSNLLVLVGSRDAGRGEEAVKKIGTPNVRSFVIDVSNESSIRSAVERMKTEFGGLDILVNNAGVANQDGGVNIEGFHYVFNTNYYGLLNTTNAFLPLLRDNGRVINVSSALSVIGLQMMPLDEKKKWEAATTVDELNALVDEFKSQVAAGTVKAEYPYPLYTVSKVAVSLLTRIQARNATRGITFNSGCPGWCQTELSDYNKQAPRSADEGARTFTKMALAPSNEYTNGDFWENEKVSSLDRSIEAERAAFAAQAQAAAAAAK